jgi:hypothetical protein
MSARFATVTLGPRLIWTVMLDPLNHFALKCRSELREDLRARATLGGHDFTQSMRTTDPLNRRPSG